MSDYSEQIPSIVLKKVKHNHLKSVSLELQHNQLVVFTGVSGCGKSSILFDVLYAEGQRRYIESLPAQVRRHMNDLPKPEAELISGLSPTIAIEQKTSGNNPRSTVGTMTGIYDYLRVLYAHIAIPHCPVGGDRVQAQSKKQIIDLIRKMPLETELIVLAPVLRQKKGEHKALFQELKNQGFKKIRVQNNYFFLEKAPRFDIKKAHDIDLVVGNLILTEELRDEEISAVVDRAFAKGQGVAILANEGKDQLVSQTTYSFASGIAYAPLEPIDFSFNHPSGACERCQGLGYVEDFDLSLIIDPTKSIADDCCIIAPSYKTLRFGQQCDAISSIVGFDPHTPWQALHPTAQKAFLYGFAGSSLLGWEGVIPDAHARLAKSSQLYQERKRSLMTSCQCSECKGNRLKPYPLAALLGGLSIAELVDLSLDEALVFFKDLSLNDLERKLGEAAIREIIRRLEFLVNVGLEYLTLGRSVPTLSGGEAQRVRLAAQIGAGLVGVTYLLDEPSIGLHPRDNKRLIHTLQKLKAKGNTVLVVEHDKEMMEAADSIVDIGPLGGRGGGSIVYHGDFAGLLKEERSLTGAYLSGKLSIPKQPRRAFSNTITLKKIRHNNLKSIDIDIPLSVLIAVTGVSGSGKSSLVSDVLYPALANKLQRSHLAVGEFDGLVGVEALDKVIAIDQSPIGRTPRSNLATYTKIFDDIRDLFSELPESQVRGFSAGRFSFNVKEGSCTRCGGIGHLKVDMDFLDDQWVICEECQGKRFDALTLSITYKGKNIHQILSMTVEEASEFFSEISALKRKFDVVLEVGLGYLTLGQPSTTLSGGEAQRIKLAKELSRPSTGKTFYILDEPTTGLHFYDIHRLVSLLRRLVSLGNTVLVIEHNADVIAVADWIIDLGPEGGKGGGCITGTGTPEMVAKLPTATGVLLNETLGESPATKAVPLIRDSHDELVRTIEVVGACQNNLKNQNAQIPRGKITVCTGPSGSGKSSFLFDTIYAEGQRRYVEVMPSQMRQFVMLAPPADVESIKGLSPAIAIEQKIHAGNPRSTVGTITEIYDFLRVIYAHLGEAFCPETGEKIEAITSNVVLETVLKKTSPGEMVCLLSPEKITDSSQWEIWKASQIQQGVVRIRLNGEYLHLQDPFDFNPIQDNQLFAVIDRVKISANSPKRLIEAINRTADLCPHGFMVALPKEDIFFNLAFGVLSTGKSYPRPTPQLFSFNTEAGRCLACLGIGKQGGARIEKDETLAQLYPADVLSRLCGKRLRYEHFDLCSTIWGVFFSSVYRVMKEQPAAEAAAFYRGYPQEIRLSSGLILRWDGINQGLEKLQRTCDSANKEYVEKFLEPAVCSVCQGGRLNALAAAVRVEGVSLPEICDKPLDEVRPWIEALCRKNKNELLEEPLRQVAIRLQCLENIGLPYLSLSRSAPTLSGGEAQRVRLSRQLGSGLTGALYILDEPSIGLHPADSSKVNHVLRALRDLGNTVLLVEHDPLTMEIADYILDFGPGAGSKGGEILARGTLEEIKKNPASLTGAYLSGRKRIERPHNRRMPSGRIVVKNANINNLINITFSIPLGVISCITGVSGSGKSTLMHNLLAPALSQYLGSKPSKGSFSFQGASFDGMEPIGHFVQLDQNPIGHTSRADICSYSDLLTPLRTLMASESKAKQLRLGIRHFSPNHPQGMCPTCMGLGVKTIAMQFLPPVTMQCADCQGYRLNPASLQVLLRGAHMGNIFGMTVEQARAFLDPYPELKIILDILLSVGLGYVKLGQEIATLSGGEAQRLRLAKELSHHKKRKRKKNTHTLYLFDEPTTGLHTHDIALLLKVLDSLVDQGDSVCVIEHNLDVMAHADYLLDMGPGSGKAGGKVVAYGAPEDLMNNPASLTGLYLKKHWQP